MRVQKAAGGEPLGNKAVVVIREDDNLNVRLLISRPGHPIFDDNWTIDGESMDVGRFDMDKFRRVFAKEMYRQSRLMEREKV